MNKYTLTIRDHGMKNQCIVKWLKSIGYNMYVVLCFISYSIWFSTENFKNLTSVQFKRVFEHYFSVYSESYRKTKNSGTSESYRIVFFLARYSEL